MAESFGKPTQEITEDAYEQRVRQGLETLGIAYMAETRKDFTHWDWVEEPLPDGTGGVYYIVDNPDRIWKEPKSSSLVYQSEQAILEQIMGNRATCEKIVEDWIYRYGFLPSEAEIACYAVADGTRRIEVRRRKGAGIIIQP
jgi:hypothetical protein